MDQFPWVLAGIILGGLTLFGLCALGNLGYQVLERVVEFKLEIMEEEHKAKIRVLKGLD